MRRTGVLLLPWLCSLILASACARVPTRPLAPRTEQAGGGAPPR